MPAVILAILALCALLSGCASPDSEAELPWNTPQSWEASPMIPGMDRY